MSKREAEAEAPGASEKRIKGLVAIATRLSERLEECYGELRPGDLLSNQTWCRLTAPDMSRSFNEFDYMGRAFTRDVVDFILQPPEGPPRLLDPFASRKYITGTPGYGKTVSVCAGTGFLYVKSAMARRAPGEMPADRKDANQEVDKAEEWVLPDLADCRFVLLSGKSFVQNPLHTFLMALVLAYLDDAGALAELHKVADRPDDVFMFIRSRSEKLYIVLDDGNAVDLDKADPPRLADLKVEAGQFVELVPGNIVVCASVRSKLRLELAKTPGATYLLSAGGFEMTELNAYLKHLDKKIEDFDPYMTGWVPRLVDVCLLQTKEKLKQTIEQLEGALRESILVSEGLAREELLRAMAGRRISQLSKCVDSRCYYQDKNGKGRCLTRHLHSRALGWVAQCAQRKQDVESETEVLRFTSPISGSSNLCSIGWNAEEATILALKLLDTELTGVNAKIRPRAVRIFGKQITRRMLTTKTPTLFIPSRFNHTGADVYYADQQTVVVFQISVAEKPIEMHTKTKPVAEKLFQGDSRTKVLAWVIVQDGSQFVAAPEDGSGYAEVFTTFEDLHYSLQCIDERVKKLRGIKNRLCKLCGKVRSGVEVECHFCGRWYHGNCADCRSDEPWICEDCKHGRGDTEDEEEDSSDGDYEEEDEDNEDEV